MPAATKPRTIKPSKAPAEIRGHRLLTRAECAARLSIHPDEWDTYWPDYPLLLRGARRVRCDKDTEGRRRWTEYHFDRHLNEDCR